MSFPQLLTMLMFMDVVKVNIFPYYILLMCIVCFYNADNSNSVDHLYEDFEQTNLITPADNKEVRFSLLVISCFCSC